MSNKPLILVVDDNVINRQYFSMSLKKSGYDVIAVEGGKQAIEQANITKFDVILMDIRMPEMDGYECTRHIRNIPLQEKTPIYAASAEELFKEYSDLFADFLLKPISPKQLNDTVRQHIQDKPMAFNQENALKFAYNDREIVKTLTDLFIREFPKQLQTLCEFSDNNEVQKCLDLVHKIKGSCRACGAQQIEGLLDDFSTLCHEKRENSLHRKLDELQVALNTYKDSIL